MSDTEAFRDAHDQFELYLCDFCFETQGIFITGMHNI